MSDVKFNGGGLPWTTLLIAGGAYLVWGTDVPAVVGWIMIGFGILRFVFGLLILAGIAAALSDTPGYRTTYGRKRRLPRG